MMKKIKNRKTHESGVAQSPGSKGALYEEYFKGFSKQSTEDRFSGLRLAKLNTELRAKYTISKAVNGMIVLEIDPSSPAGGKCIKVGDVIVEVAQQPVTSIDDVRRGVDKIKQTGHFFFQAEDGIRDA